MNVYLQTLIALLNEGWISILGEPTDRMQPDLPQEEEIALGHLFFFSFYYWFYSSTF
jgi:hypothetical protein